MRRRTNWPLPMPFAWSALARRTASSIVGRRAADQRATGGDTICGQLLLQFITEAARARDLNRGLTERILSQKLDPRCRGGDTRARPFF